MSNYNQIKEKELETTKTYSKKKFYKYLRRHRIIRGLYSELFFWSVSLIPFFIYPLLLDNTLDMWLFFTVCHFFYWKFYGEKKYHQMTDSDIKMIDVTIDVLEEIKKEKYG